MRSIGRHGNEAFAGAEISALNVERQTRWEESPKVEKGPVGRAALHTAIDVCRCWPPVPVV